LSVKVGNESPNVGVDIGVLPHHGRDGDHDYGFSALFTYLFWVFGQ
jgi:hypothetical protein